MYRILKSHQCGFSEVSMSELQANLDSTNDEDTVEDKG